MIVDTEAIYGKQVTTVYKTSHKRYISDVTRNLNLIRRTLKHRLLPFEQPQKRRQKVGQIRRYNSCGPRWQGGNLVAVEELINYQFGFLKSHSGLCRHLTPLSAAISLLGYWWEHWRKDNLSQLSPETNSWRSVTSLG